MPKKRSKTHKQPERNTVEHFQAFLAAADRHALQFLVREGIVGDLNSDRNEYYNAIEDLAERFCPKYERTKLDDLCTLEQLMAHQDGAYMLGFAVGMRLHGANLTAGAK